MNIVSGNIMPIIKCVNAVTEDYSPFIKCAFVNRVMYGFVWICNQDPDVFMKCR